MSEPRCKLTIAGLSEPLNGTSMMVAVEVFEAVSEPYLDVGDENGLGLLLRPGFVEVGLRRAAITRETFHGGENPTEIRSDKKLEYVSSVRLEASFHCC